MRKNRVRKPDPERNLPQRQIYLWWNAPSPDKVFITLYNYRLYVENCTRVELDAAVRNLNGEVR